MIIQDVDQLVCIDESDSFASSMGMTFPTDGGNAQYYEKTGDTVSQVSPSFSDANNKRMIYFPQIFSAIGNQYLTPGANDIFTFRLNNLSSENAIIAQGTLSQFAGGTALVNGSRVWSTAAQGKAQTYAQVFKAMTQTFNGITVPALAIIGDPAYGTQADIQIYCTCQFENGKISCKGDFEIRPMSDTAFKVVIEASSSLGGNDQVIDASSEYIMLTASLLKNGSASGISGATYKWWKLVDKGDDTKVLTAETGHPEKLKVVESMVNGHQEFVVEVTYESSAYYATITINDIQDQWVINKGRTVYADSNKTTTVENSNIIKAANVVSYTPTIVDSHTGSAYSGSGSWSFGFVLKDNHGTTISTSSAVPFEVSGSVVKQYGGVNVHITATNSSI
jgi:hypothetical protein